MRIFSLKRINKKIKKMKSESKFLSSRQEDEEDRTLKNMKIRKNLQQTFMKEDLPMSGDDLLTNSAENDGVKCIGTNVFSRMNLSKPRKAIVTGAEKIGRTFRTVGSTFGKISQLLGRTPTKLYSPFGIETPHCKTERDYHFNPDTPDHQLSPRKKRKCGVSWKFMKRRPRSLFH